MEKNNRKKLIIVAAVILLLLLGTVLGLKLISGIKKVNTMTVVETQDNSLYIPSYDENDSHVFNFLPAEDAKGNVIYELISAKDEKYNDVDYFSLVSDKDTRILVERATPAGTYTLTIRAHAFGDSKYAEADKDITYLYTISKADNSYLVEPNPVEDLVYNGNPQQLVHEGIPANGTIMYKVDEGEWSEKVPAATDAGIYTVSYKLVGDPNHADIDERSFMVVIEQKSIGYKSGVSYSGSTASLSDLLKYIKQKSEEASSKTAVSGKPATYVEYTYDGNVHSNGYNAPTGIDMVGVDHGTLAGTYVAIYTPDKNHCWNDRTRTPVTVTLKIVRKKLAVPVVNDVLVYNGELQNVILEGFDEKTMIAVGTCGTKAGTYHTVITLKDKINYAWENGKITDVILEWHIFKKAVTVPKVTTVYTYKATSILDIPVVQKVYPCDFDYFDNDLMKIESGDTGLYPGDYEVELRLKDKNNYQWDDETGSSENRMIPWTINRKPVGDKPAESIELEYNGKIQYNGYDAPNYVRSRGTDHGRNVGTYVAYYKPYNHYCWSDGTYDEVEVTLTIKQAQAKITKEATAKKLVYTGKYQELITEAKANSGSVLYKVDSKGSTGNYTHYIPTGMKAGTYNVYYYAEGNDNYISGEDDPSYVEVVIEKAEPKIDTHVQGVVAGFDGEKHELVKPGASEHGTFEYSMNGTDYSTEIPEESEAGDYTVYVRFVGDENHKDKDPFTVCSKILKNSDTDYSEEPEAIDSVYDGQPHDLISSGSVDISVGTILFSLDGEQWSQVIPQMSEVGEYNVYFMIKGSNNYEDSVRGVKTAKIFAAEFVIRNNDQTYDYDGESHGNGLNVITADGKPAKVTYSYEGSKYSEEVPQFSDVYSSRGSKVLARTISYKVEAKGHVTAEGTYTILINRVDPLVDISYPDLTYDKEYHELIEADVEGGKILYSKSGYDSSFRDDVPTGKDAGDYSFYYRIDGDNNHNDIDKVQTSNTIEKASISVKVPDESFDYNGQAQGDAITAYTEDGTDVNIRYRQAGSSKWTTAVPKITNVKESCIIEYEVTADDHITVTGSYDLRINPVNPEYTAPSAIQGLSYTGSYQELITAGSSLNGTMMYKVIGEGIEGNYSSSIPTGLNAMTYWVSYYCAGDENHKDSEPASFEITIGRSEYVELSLAEKEGTLEAGESMDIKIYTNSFDGSLTCESSSADVSCSIDNENMTLHLTAGEKIGDGEANITVLIEGGNYVKTYDTFKLTLKGNINPEDMPGSEQMMRVAGSKSVYAGSFNDLGTEDDFVEDINSGFDLMENNVNDNENEPVEEPENDSQNPNDPIVNEMTENEIPVQKDSILDVNEIEIVPAGADILGVDILSQIDKYGEPVSYFTKEGRLIKPAKEVPPGTYLVEVKVTIAFYVDENGNTEAVILDKANEAIEQEIIDSLPEGFEYIETQNEESGNDNDEEMIIPDIINDPVVIPEVVETEPDDPDNGNNENIPVPVEVPLDETFNKQDESGDKGETVEGE